MGIWEYFENALIAGRKVPDSTWAFHNYVLLTEQECGAELGATIYEVLINV